MQPFSQSRTQIWASVTVKQLYETHKVRQVAACRQDSASFLLYDKRKSYLLLTHMLLWLTRHCVCLCTAGHQSLKKWKLIKSPKKSKTKCFNLLLFPHLLAGTTSPNVIKQLLLIVKLQVRPDDGLIGDWLWILGLADLVSTYKTGRCKDCGHASSSHTLSTAEGGSWRVGYLNKFT